GEELPEIVEADEGEAPAEQLDAIDAVEQRLDRRHHPEEPEQDEERGHEQVCVPDAPGVETGDGPSERAWHGRRIRGRRGPRRGRRAGRGPARRVPRRARCWRGGAGGW